MKPPSPLQHRLILIPYNEILRHPPMVFFLTGIEAR